MRTTRRHPRQNGWFNSFLPRLRFRFRSLLLLIATTALILGLIKAYSGQRLRDRLAREELIETEKAIAHESERAICQAAIKKNVSYDLTRARFDPAGLWTMTTSWSEEAKWHENFADTHRSHARYLSRRRQQAQSRIIWPF